MFGIVGTLGLAIDSRRAVHGAGQFTAATRRVIGQSFTANRSLNQLNRTMTATGRIASRLGLLLGGFISLRFLAVLQNYSDMWVQLTNRLKVVESSTEAVAFATEELFEIAQRTRTSFSATVQLYSRVKLATDELGVSSKDARRFVEGVGQALTINGSSAQEARASLVQFSQALGSGIFRAEEFNSVMEGGRRILVAVADGMGITLAQLRTMVLQGEVTSKMLYDAFFSQLDELQSEFEKTRKSIGQAFIQLSNAFLRFIGRFDDATGITEKIADAITFLSNNLERAILYTTVLGTAFAATFSAKIIGAIKAITIAIKAMTLAIASSGVGLIAVAIGAAAVALYELRDRMVEIEGQTYSVGALTQATFEHIWEMIKFTASTIFQAGKLVYDRIMEIVNGVGAVVDTLLRSANLSFGTFTTAIWQAAKRVFNVAIGLLKSFFDIFIDTVTQVARTVSEVATTVFDLAVGNISFGQAASRFAATAASGVGNVASQTIKTLADNLGRDYVEELIDVVLFGFQNIGTIGGQLFGSEWEEQFNQLFIPANAKESILARARELMKGVKEEIDNGVDQIKTDPFEKFRESLLSLSQDASREIAKSFQDMIFGAESLSEAIENLTRRIAEMAFEMFVTNQIAASLSSLFNSFIGGFGSAGGGPQGIPAGSFDLPTFAAMGHAFGGGQVVPMAMGGIVDSPTFRPMSAGRTALMGEAGPEAVLPLRRTSSGRLGVESSGGGGSVVVNINISTPNADSFRKSQRQVAREMAAAVRNAR